MTRRRHHQLPKNFLGGWNCNPRDGLPQVSSPRYSDSPLFSGLDSQDGTQRITSASTAGSTTLICIPLCKKQKPRSEPGRKYYPDSLFNVRAPSECARYRVAAETYRQSKR